MYCLRMFFLVVARLKYSVGLLSHYKYGDIAFRFLRKKMDSLSSRIGSCSKKNIVMIVLTTFPWLFFGEKARQQQFSPANDCCISYVWRHQRTWSICDVCVLLFFSFSFTINFRCSSWTGVKVYFPDECKHTVNDKMMEAKKNQTNQKEFI